jgi:hypothetical protein
MEDNDALLYAVMFFGVIVLMVGIICLKYQVDMKTQLKQDAIQLGYADYNATNGKWQWKTNMIKIERQ